MSNPWVWINIENHKRGIMSRNKPQIEKIVNRLILLIEKVSDGNVSNFAFKSGVPQQTLHNYTKGRIPSGEQLYNICSNIGVDINWLLTGEGPMFRDEMEASAGPTPSPVDLDRYNLIHRFENKDLAKKIALNLLEIEKFDKDGLKSISDKTEGLLEGLRLSSEKARRQMDQLAKSTTETVGYSLRQLSNTTSEMAKAPLKQIGKSIAELIRENTDLKRKLAEAEAGNRDPDMTTTPDVAANET